MCECVITCFSDRHRTPYIRDNMRQNKHISLVITTYNSPEFLEIVLRSAMRQYVMPLEIIIADDGSAQPTRDVIERYQKISPVPIIHSWIPDEGFRVAMARNRAIMQAHGEYIVLIDGDIVMSRHFIDDHARLMQRGTFVAGSRARLNESATLRRKQSLNPSLHFFSRGLGRRFVMLRLPFLSKYIKGKTGLKNARSCHIAFYKDDFVRINGFEEQFVGWGFEDSDFVQRLYNAGLTRRNAKLMASAVHLWHKSRSEAQSEAENRARLEDTVRSGRIKAHCGIEQAEKEVEK